MRAVVTADLHFSKYSMDKIIEISELPERLHNLNIVLDQMTDYMAKNEIEIMIIAGDTLHNKSVIHSIAIATFLDFIRKNTNITFYIIDGNHDMSTMVGKGVSSLKGLESEPNTVIIHEACEIYDGKILMVPWNYNFIPSVKSGKAEYLISHFGLSEGSLSSGISIVSDIKISDLKNYKTVLLGHYHKPQTIVGTQTSVYYVGSPIQLDMGEKNEEKRFLDVNFETGEIISILTEGYKKFYQFKIDDEANVDEIITEAKKLKSEGHAVSLELLSDVELKMEENEFRIIDKRDVDITNRGITSEMDEASKLKAYCEIRDIESEDIDYYVAVGVQIINDSTGV